MQDESRTIELINGDIDGTLAGAEKAELARLLLQDPELRRLHADLRRSDELLLRVASADPPAGLRESILGALPARRPPGAAAPREAGWSRFRYAASLVAGLAIVGLGYGLAQQGADPVGLKGSAGGVFANVFGTAPATQAALSGGGFAGRATLTRTADGVRLDILVEDPAPVELRALFDPRQLAPARAAGADTPGAALIPVGQGPGARTVSFTATDRAEVRVRVETLAAGQTLAAADLVLPAGR